MKKIYQILTDSRMSAENILFYFILFIKKAKAKMEGFKIQNITPQEDHPSELSSKEINMNDYSKINK